MPHPYGASGRRRWRATPAARASRRGFRVVSIGVLPLLDSPVGAVGVFGVPLTLVMGGGPSGATIAALPDTAPELEVGQSAIKGRLPLTDVVAIDSDGLDVVRAVACLHRLDRRHGLLDAVDGGAEEGRRGAQLVVGCVC